MLQLVDRCDVSAMLHEKITLNFDCNTYLRTGYTVSM